MSKLLNMLACLLLLSYYPSLAQTNCRFTSERGILRNLSAGEAVDAHLVGTVSGQFEFALEPGEPAPVFSQVWSLASEGQFRENGQGHTYFEVSEPAEIIDYDVSSGTGTGQFMAPCGYQDYITDTPNIIRGVHSLHCTSGIARQCPITPICRQLVSPTNSPLPCTASSRKRISLCTTDTWRLASRSPSISSRRPPRSTTPSMGCNHRRPIFSRSLSLSQCRRVLRRRPSR